MVATEQTGGPRWTRERAALLGLLCLIAGIGGGWFVRGTRNPAGTERARIGDTTAAPSSLTSATSLLPGPDRTKPVEAQAAPLIERLKADPNNFELLTSLGNLYYDSQQYSAAVGFYQRALKVQPSDASVRTDLGTAYWYLGDPDGAIAEFDAALSYVPNNPNTLFNRGLIRWQGKRDAAGATADWQKLLATDPNYEGKHQVTQLLSDVAAQAPSK